MRWGLGVCGLVGLLVGLLVHYDGMVVVVVVGVVVVVVVVVVVAAAAAVEVLIDFCGAKRNCFFQGSWVASYPCHQFWRICGIHIDSLGLLWLIGKLRSRFSTQKD